ncbi:hypothetical protein D9602_01010 [Sphingomonas sp. TX0522]|nr:hypothetical protein [Sphingomonas sp. TX0522]
MSADGALAIHFRRRALPAISMEVVIGVSRGSIVLPRQGEVAPPKAVTEGADRNVPHNEALPLPPPPSCLRHATSPWRGRTSHTASNGGRV